LSKQRYEKVIFESILCSICYSVIFTLFSWDKIYYIIKGEGDDAISYFIYIKHDVCEKHNSRSCGCKLNISKNEYNLYSQKYLDFYRLSCAIITIYNGKVSFLRNYLSGQFIHYWKFWL